MNDLPTQLLARSGDVGPVGHTWKCGPAASARDLSRQRAQDVADALIGRGLPADRIISVDGVGYDAPIDSQGADPAAAAVANRVVVVTIHP